ncbi:MAG TPA: Inward rectifier potassium channel, partial [Paraburkholderia sp.]|nr:Inward rectifier potassium channel [Paraburkholderia sp.]
ELVRNIYDLKLERDHHPVFVMGWNIVHKIDESSPLFRQTPESLKTSDTQLILSIEGTDDNTDQFMRSRHVYSARQIRWQHRYTNLVNIESNGVHRIDYARFHDVDPV